MQVIQPREYERSRQLLPGTIERDAALVDNIEELKLQMEKANQEADRKSIITMVIGTVVVVSALFLAKGKFSDYFKIVGVALSIGALAGGAAKMKSVVKEVPRSDSFSAKDRAYSFLGRLHNTYKRSAFLHLLVKVLLDIMVVTKMIKPSDISNKQILLSTHRVKVKEDVRLAILEYQTNAR